MGKFKHGHAGAGKQSSEYRIWGCMIDRCENENCPAYKDYGGRGIKVCKRWRGSFELFLKDVGSRPSKNHTLDRWPNNDGDYKPSNFRWATRKEQARNTRATLIVTYSGVEKSLRSFCEDLNLDFRAVWHRIVKENLTVKKALEKPFKRLPKGRRGTLKVLHNGEEKDLHDWCKELSLDYKIMRWAIFKKGMPVKEAFVYKAKQYKKSA